MKVATCPSRGHRATRPLGAAVGKSEHPVMDSRLAANFAKYVHIVTNPKCELTNYQGFITLGRYRLRTEDAKSDSELG